MVERGVGEQHSWQTAGDPGGARSQPDAFSEAFTRYAPALYDFLARLSGRVEAADALLRQAASQAAMAAASASEWPTMRAWLFARALAVLPSEGSAAGADPAIFGVPDPVQLPPSPPESGLADMARVVWRAVSALSVGQHALLQLHVRERMTTGEVASVLGITEQEVTERLTRIVAAVEETSRALFLIRYGRSRDPRLSELLADHNVTRLTPELRGFLEDYLRTSPSAQAMLAAVPAPLAVYAAFRPVPLPSGLVADAAAAALPWLAANGGAFPPGAAAAPTAAIAPSDVPTSFVSEIPPTYDPAAPTAVNGAYPGYAEPTAVNPAFAPGAYDPPAYASGGYDPHGYGSQMGYSAPPPGSGSIEGTQMLDIPVRQRVVGDAAPIYLPPRRPPSSGPNPLAIIGGAVGALALVVLLLVLFLARGAGQANARVTATVLLTVSPTALAPTVPDALLTSTAIASNRALTATAFAGTPTAIPTATPPPQTIRTGVPNAPTIAVPTVAVPTPPTPAETPTVALTIEPPFTVAPDTAARPAPIVTRPIPTMQPTPATSPQATGVATVVSTAGAAMITTAAPTTASTAAATARPMGAATATAPPASPPAPTAKPTVAAPAAETAAVATAKVMAQPTAAAGATRAATATRAP